MYKNFTEYMYFLLMSPLKKAKKSVNQFFILFSVLGSVFDDIKNRINLTRDSTIIITSNEDFLNVHGKDRNLPRLADEDIETYRTRLIMKSIVAERAGTRFGLLTALSALGYKQTDIIATRLYDPVRWAEFYVSISPEEIDLIKNFSIVKTVIRDVKPARSLPNYWFKVSADINTNQLVSNQFKISITDMLNASELETVNVIIKIDVKNDIYFENEKLKYGENMKFLDGTWNLDGSVLLNSIINEEAL